MSEKLSKEFAAFMETPSSEVPTHLSKHVLSESQMALNPNPWKIFSKVSSIQVIVGFITLLFCPQFGISLTGVHGIMHIFMVYGETACMFACGCLFAGSSAIVTAMVLSFDEVRVLRHNRVLHTSLLSLLVAGTFLCLGAEVFEVLTLAWIAGSILGGMASLELGWLARKWLTEKVLYA